jgi:hypothetical protein
MVLEPVIHDVRQYLQDISSGSTRDFVEQFSFAHVDWHNWEARTGTGQFNNQLIDFLSYHHEVVQAYIGVLRKNNEPVPSPLGFPVPRYDTRIDSIRDPYSFSRTLEGWHGLVHTNVRSRGGPYPDWFDDPAENVKHTLFWQFHFLIESKFLQWLQNNNMRYEDVDHTIM